MNAYVINAETQAATDWSAKHWAWFVGAYVPLRGKQIDGLKPTADGISEDVREHLTLSVQA